MFTFFHIIPHMLHLYILFYHFLFFFINFQIQQLVSVSIPLFIIIYYATYRNLYINSHIHILSWYYELVCKCIFHYIFDNIFDITLFRDTQLVVFLFFFFSLPIYFVCYFYPKVCLVLARSRITYHLQNLTLFIMY